MYKKIFLSLFLAVCFSLEAGFAQASFSAKTDFATGTEPYSVATGDFNGDGKIDMAVANTISGTVSVFLNTTTPGAGAPSFSDKVDFETGINPYSVSVGDFNGDGMIDMAVANVLSSSVSVLLNTTAPGAETPSFSGTDFTTGTNPNSVSIGDFNGDGMVDMAVTNHGSNTVSVLLNTTAPGSATPTFSAKADFLTGHEPYSVALGDFNGDGKDDMAVANYGSDSVVSVFINTTAPGATTPTFSARTDFTPGSGPYSVSIGDFTGDGKIDMAVANVGSTYISVFLNTTTPGSTTPTFSTKTDFTTGIMPTSVSIEDFNGDGKCDMAVANAGSNTVSVLFNTTSPGSATPTFSAKTDFGTGAYPCSISSGDFNGDGKSDMAIVNCDSSSVSVLLNTTTMGVATPSFSAKTDFTTGSMPIFVSMGDFNGDGKSDMAVANYTSNTVSVFLNTTAPGATTPTFSAKTDFTTGTYPNSVSIGDFNGDGKNDMAVANHYSKTVSVFLNTTPPGAATPSFSAKTDFTTGGMTFSVSIGDFNGDGKNDMAVTNSGSDTVSVFLNTTAPGAATPSFSARTDFTTGSYPFSVSIGDFNGDGKIDIAVANEGARTVSVFLNTTAPGATAPSFSDKTDFATGTRPYSVSIGDFNGDGKIDMAVANEGSASVSVLLNTTAPGATTPSFSDKADFTTGTQPYSVAIGDFNGDGKNDLTVANGASFTVSILLNTTAPGATTPSFSDKTDFTTGHSPYSVSISDLNGDGKNDVAVANASSNTVSVLLNTAAFPTSVELTSFTPQAPATFTLAQNYPNPFNPATTFQFDLPAACDVKLVVLNILGQEVAEVVNKHLPAGTYDYSWNAKNMSSGVYFYKLTTNQFSSVRKMLMIK
jgi:hypothetical protein